MPESLQSKVREHLKLPLFFIAYELFILVQYTVTGGFFTTLAFYGLLLPASLYYGFQHKDRITVIARQPLLRAYSVFFIYVMIHAIFINDGAVQFAKTINHVLAIVAFLIGTIIYFAYIEEKHLVRFFNFLVLAVLACAIVSLILYNYHGKYQNLRLIPIGRANIPTVAAYMYTMAAMIILYLYETTTTKKLKPFYVMVFCLIGYMLILMETRVSTIMYLLVAFGWLAISAVKSKKTLLISIILLAVIVCVSIYNPTIHDMLMQRYDRMLARGLSFRIEIWKQTLEKIIAHPWFGYGWSANLETPAEIGAQNRDNPHNIYLSTAFYAGIPAALYLFTVLCLSIYRSPPQDNKGKYMYFLATALLLHALCVGITDQNRVIRNAGPFWIIFWMPIGMLMAVNLRDKRTSHD